MTRVMALPALVIVGLVFTLKSKDVAGNSNQQSNAVANGNTIERNAGQMNKCLAQRMVTFVVPVESNHNGICPAMLPKSMERL